MINQIYKLNMIPDKVPVMVRVSQYDQYSRTIIFDLYDGAIEYEIPTGSTITIRGTKPDKTGFEYPCTFTGNRVEFLLEPQVSVISGLVPAELRITSNNEIVGSCNFIFNVEETPLDKDTIISDTELPLIEEASQAAVIAQGAAARAKAEADRAEQVLSTAVKSVNGELPDASGNVEIKTGGVPSGGTTGQIIVKLSNDDGDVEWQDNNKMDFVQSPTANDILLVDSNGQAVDSGKQLSQLQELLTAGTGIDITGNEISNKFQELVGVDLNNIKYNYLGYVRSVTNGPTENGLLISVAGSQNVQTLQIFRTLSTSQNLLYTRFFNAGDNKWTSWEKLSTISTPTITIGDISNSNIIAKQQGDVVFLDGYVVSNAKTYTASSTVLFTTNVKPSATRFFPFFNYSSAGPNVYVAKWQPDGKVVLNNTITFNSPTYLFFNTALPI